MDNSRIVTQDKDRNIYFGSIVVNDSERLKRICYELLNDSGEYGSFRTGRSTNVLKAFRSDCLESPIRVGNELVYRDIVNQLDNDKCEYTKRKVECLRLNSILLFISLLGELDSKYYADKPLAKDFIQSGMVQYLPFNQIWNQCSTSMVDSIINEMKFEDEIDESAKLKKINLRKRDLLTFRTALEEGLISYQVDQKVEDLKNPLFKGVTPRDLRQIQVNNTLLLEDDNIFKKVRK